MDGRLDILGGDCRDILPTLPAGSVQCCVSSPPYWGLRDYGTAQWEGGDVGCDHKQGRPGSWRADGIVQMESARNRDGVGGFSMNCKCGARRIDSQLGLEGHARGVHRQHGGRVSRGRPSAAR
jgi:site-specific DNA-methyltransferase (cytosine-N4-specific)